MENIMKFNFNLVGEECELKLELTEGFEVPDYPIDSTDDDGINWYVINDQFCKKSPNGQYVYMNDDEKEEIMLIQGEKFKAIKITLDYKDNLYSGKVKENQISQQQTQLSIEDMFKELAHELTNFNNNIEDGAIQFIIQNNEIIVLTYKYFVTLGKNTKKFFDLIFNLVKQEEKIEYTFEKKIKKLQKTFENQILKQKEEQSQEFIQFQTEMQNNLNLQKYAQASIDQKFQNDIKQINDNYNLLLEKYQELSIQYDEQKILQENKFQAEQQQAKLEQELSEIQDSLQKSDLQTITIQNLQKTQGYFSVLPKQLTGVNNISFKIRAFPSYGLVIGLDHTTNPVNIVPAYIYLTNLTQSLLIIGQNQTQIQYFPQVGDQIGFIVDMNQRKAVLQANKQQIIEFQLDDQTQTELYLCVGYFNEQEDITHYIE